MQQHNTAGSFRRNALSLAIVSATTIAGLTMSSTALAACVDSSLGTDGPSCAQSVLLNSTNISTNVVAIADNATSIGTNSTNVATNSTNISNTQTSVATNSTNVATNSTNISNTQTSVATNSTNVATNSTN
ncbi:MAG: hypothetical protein V7717_12345, partial [Porticoccaceae bacterium]